MGRDPGFPPAFGPGLGFAPRWAPGTDLRATRTGTPVPIRIGDSDWGRAAKDRSRATGFLISLIGVEAP